MNLKLLKVFLAFNVLVLSDCDKSVVENDLKNSIDIELLQKTNFLVGILKTVVKKDEPTQCALDSQIILNAIETKKLWAIKLIDAYGEVPPSFTWGNNFWYSPKAACDALNRPITHSLSSRYHRNFHPDFFTSLAPFPMELLMVYGNFTSPYFVDIRLQIQQVLHVGLCVPASCSVKQVTQIAGAYFKSNGLRQQQVLDIDVEFVGAKRVGIDWTFVLSPSVVLFLMMVISLITLPIVRYISKKRQDKEMEAFGGSNTSVSDLGSTTFSRFLECFDIQENLSSLYQWNPAPPNFGCISGMRVLICFWVVALHATWFPMFTYNNTLQMVKTLDGFIIQPIYQAFLYVDVFFVISAFLLVYNFLTNCKRLEEIRSNSFSENVKLFCKMVLYRYLRLAPLLIGTTMLSDIVYNYLDIDTPFFANETSDLYCKDNWWHNILFIQNVNGMRTMCVSWSWYLACDMQFFMIFTSILFVYATHKILAKFLYAVVGVTFISISFYCYYTNSITFQYDVLFQTSDHLYTKPWTRMCSYIGGVFMGWVMHQIRDRKFTVQKDILALYWIAIFLIFVVSITMTLFKNTPVIVVALIMSLGRTVFGIFIGSMIIMCEIGYGGYFKTVLESKFLVHFSQFTYAIYLCAPIHLTFMYGFRRSSSAFDEVMNVYDITGSFTSSYVHGILAVAFLEIPFIKIANKFVLPKKR